ncbi:integrase protein [Rhizobium phage RHph_Y48]|nr:integrase protein [Rhizobium phage RHph_Y48]QIG70004.1 integrase protein [Rhizobium phage RHph_Y86]QIG70056.1 integrase protein [Rhizobium phage RHph_Y2_7]
MVTVDLKGIHRVRSKGNTYYYAWRGGPRLKSKPGTAAFIAEYNEALESRIVPDHAKFRSLIRAYEQSTDYQKLAASTKRNWSRMLKIIDNHFGDISIAQFDRTKKIRPIIRQWRGQYAETPRTADYGMQVLSRVLSYAVDPLGKIATNPCEGIKSLYSNDRSTIIWTDEDIQQFKTARDKNGKLYCSTEMALALDLAILTGLRVGDLVRLRWDNIHADAIIIKTGKSNGKREAVVPLYAELHALLCRIPKRDAIVLTSSHGTPWTENGLASSFHTAKKGAGLNQKDLHWHDLRGTAATKFYTAGLSERVIAEIMGWSEDEVKGIIRRYVDRSAATRAVIEQMNASVKRAVKQG